VDDAKKQCAVIALADKNYMRGGKRGLSVMIGFSV